jgi:hypothetical protein
MEHVADIFYRIVVICVGFGFAWIGAMLVKSSKQPGLAAANAKSGVGSIAISHVQDGTVFALFGMILVVVCLFRPVTFRNEHTREIIYNDADYQPTALVNSGHPSYPPAFPPLPTPAGEHEADLVMIEHLKGPEAPRTENAQPSNRSATDSAKPVGQ